MPPGTYELVCWLPNWREQRRHRDPETALILRLYFQPPVTQTQRVTVPVGDAVEVNCTFRPEMFRD